MEEKAGRGRYRRGEVLQNLFIVLLLAIGLYFMVPRLIGVSEMLDVISHANLFMLPLALAVETLSMLSICFLYFELQREGGGRLSFGRTSLIFMSAYAFGHIVPGGNAGTFYLNYVEMRREGLSRTLTLKVLTAANLFYSGAMICLCIAGLVVSLFYPDLTYGYKVTALLVATGLLVFLLACALLIRNEALLERLALRLVRGLRRMGAWKGREESSLVANIMEVRRFFYALVTHRDSLLRNGFYALSYWCMDMACLFIVFIALGAPVNPGIVIIAYAIADLLGSLPLTPAGLGIFEVSMGAIFYAYGYPVEVLAAAVLGFRFFSFWLCTLAGGVCYVFLRLERRKERRSDA